MAIAYSGLIKTGWEEVDITHTVCDICLKTKLCKLFEKRESSVLCMKTTYLAVCEDCFVEEFFTGFTKFPCPKCGEYFEPYLINSKGRAMMECPKHGLYETKIAVSKNFRIFCSRVAKQPNRSQSYYTKSEQKVKDFLEKNGYREGIDFIHNVRVKLNSRYYWLDFYIPRERLVIEVSPKIWHKMWNRQESDKTKYQTLRRNGLRVVEVHDKNYKEVLECNLQHLIKE